MAGQVVHVRYRGVVIKNPVIEHRATCQPEFDVEMGGLTPLMTI